MNKDKLKDYLNDFSSLCPREQVVEFIEFLLLRIEEGRFEETK